MPDWSGITVTEKGCLRPVLTFAVNALVLSITIVPVNKARKSLKISTVVAPMEEELDDDGVTELDNDPAETVVDDVTTLDEAALDTASLDATSLDATSLDAASLDAATLDTASLEATSLDAVVLELSAELDTA